METDYSNLSEGNKVPLKKPKVCIVIYYLFANNEEAQKVAFEMQVQKCQ